MSRHGMVSRFHDALDSRRRLFVAGQQVELWENPRLPFGCAFADLEAYCLDARWELLFNAIVLACLSSLDADEADAMPPVSRWASFADVDGRGASGH